MIDALLTLCASHVIRVCRGLSGMGPSHALYRTGHDEGPSPWALCPVDKRER
jgi:hypothetical protein